MKFLFLSVFVFLAACETPTLNTSQEFFIDVVGTDEAYCIVSSPHHRYAINAPGRTIIERSADDLKVDCRDNAIQRRRTMAISSDWDGLYYRYPETVIVDFSSLDSGSRYNGYRAPAPEIQKKSIIADKADKREPVLEETSKKEILFTQTLNSVLTEDSYSEPVQLKNDTMVEKKYTMGRRSYPIPLTDNVQFQETGPLTPPMVSDIDPSVQ